jgi:hypothetical protein
VLQFEIPALASILDLAQALGMGNKNAPKREKKKPAKTTPKPAPGRSQ